MVPTAVLQREGYSGAVVGRGSLLKPSDEGHWEIVAPFSQGVSAHVQQAAFTTASTVVPLHQQTSSPASPPKNKKLVEEEAAGCTPTASNGAQAHDDEMTPKKSGDTCKDKEVDTRVGHAIGGGGAQGITSQNMIIESSSCSAAAPLSKKTTNPTTNLATNTYEVLSDVPAVGTYIVAIGNPNVAFAVGPHRAPRPSGTNHPSAVCFQRRRMPHLLLGSPEATAPGNGGGG